MEKDERQRWAQEEAEFLATYDAEEFERPSVAVDVVLLSVVDSRLQVLLVERAEHPHKGRFALPGGFVAIDERLDDAARRVLASKAGIDGLWLEQLYTFGAPDRDPRTRVVSVTYMALAAFDRFISPATEPHFTAANVVLLDASRPAGEDVPIEVESDAGEKLELAFDHQDIVSRAVGRLRGKLDYAPVGFQLLPDEFTLRELQEVHETIRGEQLNKPSFRRRMLDSGQIEPTGKYEQDVDHRPAELYRFVGGHR